MRSNHKYHGILNPCVLLLLEKSLMLFMPEFILSDFIASAMEGIFSPVKSIIIKINI
jgi:hypothetical protein